MLDSYPMKPVRNNWLELLVAIIALGIASRTFHTGWIVFDKYLGDALYAAMVYVLFSRVAQTSPIRNAIVSMAAMTALELFQLTMIPARLLNSSNFAVRIVARLLGTEFSSFDLIAYSVGIVGIALIEIAMSKRQNTPLPPMLE